MIEIEKLREGIRQYQDTENWSAELHLMIDELITIVEKKFNFSQDSDDFYQSGYLVLMYAAKIVDLSKNPFDYFYSCLVNMGKQSYGKNKKYNNMLNEVYNEQQESPDRRRK